jgi:hypothetical protein
MTEFHDEQTLVKVRDALYAAGVSKSQDAITSMQNAGILFREYRDLVPEWGEVEPVDENGEYAPLKKEEYLRITGLEMAINSAVRGAADVELLTAQADLFVDYIKNGDNNG